MKVAIYCRGGQSVQPIDFLNLHEALNKSHITPVFFKELYDQFEPAFLPADHFDTFTNSDELDESFDAMISLGGDGTLLDTVCLVRDKQIPVLGINFGRLGFLASLGKENIEEAVEALKNRTFVLDKRSLVHLDASIPLFGDEPFALNEFTIHKREFSPMIKIHTYLNGELLNSYWADGLIIATPTGSTAYALSAGGPILHPRVAGILLAPIAPHSLSNRPIVLPQDIVVSIEVVDGREVIVNFDMQSQTNLQSGDTIEVRQSEKTITLLHPRGHSDYKTLREKLHWNEYPSTF